MKGLSFADYAVLAAYAVFTFALGTGAFRRKAAAREFFLASRKAGWFAVGVSLMVSLASSLGFIAVPAAAHQSGVLMLWSLAALPLVYPVVTRVFIPFYHRLDVYTAYEYLERRFDLSVRLLGSGLFIAWRVTWMAAVLYVPAMALNAASGGAIPIPAMVCATGLLATAYTILGGMRGVLMTNLAQAVVMFGGVLLTLLTILAALPQGIGGAGDAAAEAGKLQWAAPFAGWDAAGPAEKFRLYLYTDFSALAIIVSFTIGKLGNYGVDQLLIQRFLSARSEKAARSGFLFNCVIFAVFFALMTATGIALAVFSAQEAFPALKPDRIFPYYLAHHVPSGLAGLMFAALLAAAVSSFDSGVHACTTALTNDFHTRLRGAPGQAEAGSSFAARGLTLVLGALAALLGCQVGRLGDLFEIALRLVNSFIGPLLALFLLAMFSRRATSRGVFLGTVLGSACTAVLVGAGLFAGMASPGSAAAAALARLDIGFLWVCPLSLLISLAAGRTLSLLDRCPDEKQLRWTWRGVMTLPPRETPASECIEIPAAREFRAKPSLSTEVSP